MASKGPHISRLRTKKKVTSKPYQKNNESRDKSHIVPSDDGWGYIRDQGSKANLIKRNCKGIRMPVCEPKELDYESDDTIPYGPDMDEDMKARVRKHMQDTLDLMTSDSESDDITSDLDSGDMNKHNKDKNRFKLVMEEKPVSDPDINACLISSDSQSFFDIKNMNDETVADIIAERLNDLSDGFVETCGIDFSNFKDVRFCAGKNDPVFYGMVNLLNDEDVSDIDDFIEHQLQKSL